MMRTKLQLFIQLLILPACLQAQGNDTIFNSDYLMDPQKWEAVDERTGNSIIIDTLTYMNKKAFHIETFGMMSLKDLDFKNVVVEADIAGDMSNTMTGFGFRAKDFENFEYVYLRLMVSNAYDAIQYLPVYSITIPWILYPQYQATATFNSDWTHVKIEVIDKQLKVFVNNSVTPNIVVNELKGDSARGKFMIVSEFDEAYYANLTIRKLSDDTLSPAPPAPKDIYIKDWQLSGTFNIPNPSIDEYKNIVDTTTNWDTISPDNDGLVNLSKYFTDPTGTVILKKEFVADAEMNGVLLFDYARQLEIILNDSIIYSGTDNNGYMAMAEDDKYLNLKLKKGTNNLAFVSTGDYPNYINNRPHFGRYQSQNWGFIARLDTFNAMDTLKWKAVSFITGQSIAQNAITQYQNEEAFRLPNDMLVYLENEIYKNVVIEADISTSSDGWPAIGFHAKDTMNHELFYFRPSSSNSPEAIQYTPVYNSSLPWALYAGYQSSAIYNSNWTHVKIEVIDNRAKVYVNYSTSPNIIINKLRGGETTGKILLRANYKGDCYFANITITRLNDDLVSIKNPEPIKSNITTWQLSDNYNKNTITLNEYKIMKDTITSRRNISPDNDGIVNLAKYFNIPSGTAILKTSINVSEDTVKYLFFDYTRSLQIILNDSLVYKNMQNTDVIKIDGKKIIIKLKKGQNELVLISSGDYPNCSGLNFGHIRSFNWGFNARYENLDVQSVISKIELNQPGFSVFPNPTSGIVNVSFGTTPVGEAILKIYDLEGNQVFSETFHNSATATINIANLPEGIYIISISNNTATYNEIICKK